jgi:hypothetical protein
MTRSLCDSHSVVFAALPLCLHHDGRSKDREWGGEPGLIGDIGYSHPLKIFREGGRVGRLVRKFIVIPPLFLFPLKLP